jgi:AAA15 family ATPase/GTPase
MLIELKVKNFRSFKEEAILSMVASSDKSLPENTIETENFGTRKLLRSAVVYGANAAGKSNLIAAAHFIDQFVSSSADRNVGRPINVSPFLFSDEKPTPPSEFEVTFIDNLNVRYQYGFQVNSEKVLKEWLISYPKGLPQVWFERDHSLNSKKPDWYFGRYLKGKNKQVAGLTRPDVLFLSNATKLNHQQIKEVYEWFQNSLLTIEIGPLENFYENISARMVLDDEAAKSKVHNLLSIADFGIDDFEIREEIYQDKDLPDNIPVEIRNQIINKKHLDVYMKHKINDSVSVNLPIKEESNGTQRYFALSGPLTQVLDLGQTLLIDELDSSLHPLLVRYLVELFHNPITNPKGAQLIFNTHDTTLMDCCLFRRDQIWFVEKDREGGSHLYPLLDYSPRKDEALAKGYLAGRYGAIPFIGEPNWGENIDNEKDDQ